MAFLSSLGSAASFLEVAMPKGLWEWLLGTVMSFIGNYGLRILVFTVFLKILLFPLDIYQKMTMRDNAKKMARIQPELDVLKEKLGNDKMAYQQAQSQLMKREKYSMFSSCLPMIVTMVIFFSMYAGFTNITSYMLMKSYHNMYTTYTVYYENKADESGARPFSLDSLQAELDKMKTEALAEFEEKNSGLFKDYMAEFKKTNPNATDAEIRAAFAAEMTAAQSDLNEVILADGEVDSLKIFHSDVNAIARKNIAQDAVVKIYESERQSFFWIRNIWVSDVFWESPVQTKAGFEAILNRTALIGGRHGRTYLDTYKLEIEMYDTVTGKIAAAEEGKVNGFLVLVILTAGLSFLMQFLTQRQQKKNGTAQPAAGMGGMGGMQGTMKMMMYIMPVMMGFFAATSASSFAIYLVSNSLISILLLLVTDFILKFIESAREKRDSQKVHVLRAAPGEEKKPKSYRLKDDKDRYNKK